MNKKNFILLVMALCCMTFFSSCDKDEPVEDVETITLSTTLKSYTLDATNGIANNEGHYWNQTFSAEKFTSGIFTFSHTGGNNDYGGYWSGFTVSNAVDDTNYGDGWVANQWGCMTASTISSNFLVANWGPYGLDDTSGLTTFKEDGFSNWVKIEDGTKTYKAKSVSVSIHPWSYYGITVGDSFANKFTAEKDDSFKLKIYGVDVDNKINSTPVIYNLASFNSADELVIAKNWVSVDISSLGTVKYLMFQLESTDVGEWGSNTATYFCLNDIVVTPNN